jgi:hypothetical protein
MRLQTNTKRTSAVTPFEMLVREAVGITQRLHVLDQPPATSPNKHLTAEAFLRETVQLARSTLKRVMTLRKALNGESPAASATLRRMVTFIAGPNCKAPPSRLMSLRWLSNDATTAELTHIGNFTTADLFAVAVQVAGERYPEIFGASESTGSVEAELAALNRERAALFIKIRDAWTSRDVLASARDAAPCFKLAPEVPIAPDTDAAERLVNALASRASAS